MSFVRSAAADEFAAACQSEWAAPQPGGLTNKSGTDAARPLRSAQYSSGCAGPEEGEGCKGKRLSALGRKKQPPPLPPIAAS